MVTAMYLIGAGLVATGLLTPLALVAAVAAPRAVHALQVMARPRPSAPPPGYVGWPLWNHRACLVHNRLFGWVYIVGLALGAVLPGIRL